MFTVVIHELLPLTTSMLVKAAAIDPHEIFLGLEACMDEHDLISLLSSLVLVG